MCKLQTTLLISALLATPLFAENASIHSVQNQANVDLLLPNLGISEYRHLVDYLASSYPKTLSTKGMGRGEDMVFSKTFAQFYTQLLISFAHNNLKYDDIAKNVFGSNYEISSAAIDSLRGQVRLGYTFYPSSLSALTPFAQLGYEEWHLDTGGLTQNTGFALPIAGYTEIIKAKVVSLGLMAQWAMSARWVLSSDLSLGRSQRTYTHFNAFINERPFNQQEIYYQDGNLSPSTLIEAGLSSDYALTESLHGRFGLKYLNILWGSGNAHAVGPSEVVQYVPKERFSQWTISTGIGYTQ